MNVIWMCKSLDQNKKNRARKCMDKLGNNHALTLMCLLFETILVILQ